MFDKLEDKDRLEAAIRKKYGEDAVQNLRGEWTTAKDQIYKKQVSEIDYTNLCSFREEKRKNFTIKSKGSSRTLFKNCEVCNKSIFRNQDFYFYLKFDTCEHCYIQYIEDREQRWENGWRPEKKF